MRILFIVLWLVMVLGSCGEPAGKSGQQMGGDSSHSSAAGDMSGQQATEGKGDSADGSRDTTSSPSSATTISEGEIRRLMARASALYWGNYEVATEERTTIDSIPMVALDPAKVPTMERFRDRFREVYNERAIDTLLRDFRITERDGRLWMAEADGGDISEYEGTKLLETRPDGANHLIAIVSVPLGAEGEFEERVVRLERTAAGWRIESERPR